MAKKRAICPICLCPNCLIENILVFKCLIINILQITVGQIGQIGQKQIGQFHFCTLRFPKVIINNINILFIIIYIILTICNIVYWQRKNQFAQFAFAQFAQKINFSGYNYLIINILQKFPTIIIRSFIGQIGQIHLKIPKKKHFLLSFSHKKIILLRSCGGYWRYAHGESNPNQRNRNPSFYPLNYGRMVW